MCSIEAYDRMHYYTNDDAKSGSGKPLSTHFSGNMLLSLELSLKFIDTWIQSFQTNYLHQSTISCYQMNYLFKNIPVTIPERRHKTSK